MPAKTYELRERLLDAQEVTPELREACHRAIAAMLEHRLTPRSRLFLVVLLLIALALTAVGLRSLWLYAPGPMIYGVWLVYTAICAGAAVWIAASLRRKRFLWRSYFPMADAFTVAAAVIAVLALGLATNASADPKSVVGALYGLVLLVICIAWSLHNRVSSAELAIKEQLLRIECRLADLGSRLP